MTPKPSKKRLVATPENRWLLLIHQIPPKPAYLRVKIWRRLQDLGAVAIKNSVYTLPLTDEAHEDFEWVVREIVAGHGDAMVCEARLLEGISNEQVEALFHAARDADYARLTKEARRVLASASQERTTTGLEADIARLRRKLNEIVEIDFFASLGRGSAEAAIGDVEARLRQEELVPADSPPSGPLRREDYRGRTWVTRTGIHVDRIASAWLIKRFIDPKARFKFVQAKGYRPAGDELLFDMFDAQFTHAGDHCTFETLIERFAISEPALRPLAEIVHDIDLKDSKFGRPETIGVDRQIAGIAMSEEKDLERLRRGEDLFGALFEYFRRKKTAPVAGPRARSKRSSG